MKTRQQTGLGEALHVAAHRLQRNFQGLGELFDSDGAARADHIEKFELPGI